MKRLAFCLAVGLAAGPALADAPEIIDAYAKKTGMGWKIAATLSHPDEGWGHYADGWRIETSDGEVLGTRELRHPHVKEQPFTRSLSSVLVPDGTRKVYLRARCTTHGWSDATYALKVGQY